MPRLAALVVTYNRLDQLKVTLAALLATASKDLDCIAIVDNASTDGTTDWLNGQDDPRLMVRRLGTNTGGAGGFSAGLQWIRDEIDPDWTVLMDDDARPDAGTLHGFHTSERTNGEAWFGAVLLPDGTVADMNRPWRNPFWHLGTFLRSALSGRDGFHLSRQDYDQHTTQPVDGGSFVGLFLSRAGLKRAGLPDAKLFLYGDDVLYTLGLTAAGGSCLFDPTLTFTHDCETETGRFDPLWKGYYFHRNLLMVYRKAAGPILFWPVLLLKSVTWRRQAKVYGNDAGRYRALLSLAIRDGVAHRTDRPLAEVQRIASGSEPHGDSDA